MWRLASRAVAECGDWYTAKIFTEQEMECDTKNAVKTGIVKMGKGARVGKVWSQWLRQGANNASSALRAPYSGLERGEESLHIPIVLIMICMRIYERVWLFIGLNTNSTAYGETSIANTNSCNTIIKLSQAINPSVPPYPDLFVPTTTAHFFPIWAPVYRVYFVAMARQILLELPCSNIPRLERSVFTCAHQ